jgi:hypothetical protein
MALARLIEFLRSAGNFTPDGRSINWKYSSGSVRYRIRSACRSLRLISSLGADQEGSAHRLATDLRASGLACRTKGLASRAGLAP